MQQMSRTRSRIGSKRQALLEHVQLVLEELRGFWPLTLRQLYYQLVARGVIENSLGKYKRLSELLTKARLGGLVRQAIEAHLDMALLERERSQQEAELRQLRALKRKVLVMLNAQTLEG